MTLTAEQIAERRSGVGSSEIAAVCGISPYAGPHDVWSAKVYCEESIDNVHTRFGKRLEPVLLAYYAETTGHTLDCESVTRRHPDHPWALATVDGLVVVDDGDDNIRPAWIVEAKTADWKVADQWGEEGTDQIPEQYLCQVQWQMFVLDLPRADVVALVGKDWRIYTVMADAGFQAFLFVSAQQFWGYVERQELPPIDASDGCIANLGRRNRGGDYVSGVDEIEEMVVRLAQAKADIEDAETRKKRLQAEIMAAVGDDAKGYKSPLGRIGWVERSPRYQVDGKAMMALAKAYGATPEEIDAAHKLIQGGKHVAFTPAKNKETTDGE